MNSITPDTISEQSVSSIRRWTHIDDVFSGTLLAGEHLDDSTAVKLGALERVRAIDAAREVLRYSNHDAKIKLLR